MASGVASTVRAARIAGWSLRSRTSATASAAVDLGGRVATGSRQIALNGGTSSPRAGPKQLDPLRDRSRMLAQKCFGQRGRDGARSRRTDAGSSLASTQATRSRAAGSADSSSSTRRRFSIAGVFRVLREGVDDDFHLVGCGGS